MEIEKRFKCPHCHERISMLLDCSEDGVQEYIEDCEVCCQPIQLNYEARDQLLVSFSCSAAY
jgi:transcription elongation factor Elf1